MKDLPVSRPQKIALLVFPKVEELDFLGPWEMFGIWKTYAGGPDFFTVAEHSKPLVCAHGLSIIPTYGFDNCPDFDVLVIPGGVGRIDQLRNHVFMSFIRERGAHCAHILSVCTGALFLAEAGLLKNKIATTHWKFLENLRQYPEITVREGVRYVRDGNLWTAAGVYAGTDLALEFIHSCDQSDDKSAGSAAGTVQAIAEYLPDHRRYPPGIDLSAAPSFIQRAFTSTSATKEAKDSSD
ncbi:MAG: DJ-1/PfpI family protein [Pseudomonadota bacterium]